MYGPLRFNTGINSHIYPPYKHTNIPSAAGKALILWRLIVFHYLILFVYNVI